ncbi:MAG: DUF4339 domain-containing protein [Micropepsaceae bacterium]
MTASAPQLDPDQPRFAISIGGKIYGPYAADQMRSYIAEGRITASSLVSREGGPWTAASDDAFCAHILAQRARRVPDLPPAAPAAAPQDAAAATPQASPAPAAAPQSSSSSAREAFLKELEGVRGFKPAEPAQRAPGPPRPDAPQPAPAAAAFAPDRDAAQEASNFVIVFDLKSRGHNKLEEHIMQLGRAVRVLPGFWLLNATMTSGAIRNALMKHFGTMDTFIIVDATRDKLAWFNIGPEIDSQIRQVWRRS